MGLRSFLRSLTYWWVGPEWTADPLDLRMVRRRPDGKLEYRAMTPQELEDEMQARAW